MKTLWSTAKAVKNANYSVVFLNEGRFFQSNLERSSSSAQDLNTSCPRRHSNQGIEGEEGYGGKDVPSNYNQ